MLAGTYNASFSRPEDYKFSLVYKVNGVPLDFQTSGYTVSSLLTTTGGTTVSTSIASIDLNVVGRINIEILKSSLPSPPNEEYKYGVYLTSAASGTFQILRGSIKIEPV